MDKKTKPVAAEAKKAEKTGNIQFAFESDNYKWMMVGLALLVLGFVLMIGGGSDDPNVFNDAIFNFQRLTLAPILILAGYVVEIYAIMKRPKE